jgi:UDP-3-O-[3-hydroxymyristoyl] glucosamine N-acyltransferase
MRSFTLTEIAAQLGGEVVGEARVGRVASLAAADAGSIAFFANPKYRPQLDQTRAGALILGAAVREASNLPRIVVDNPYAYFARVSAMLNPPRAHAPGLHPSASVDASAQVDASASIGAQVSIEAGAHIGAGAVLEAGVRIGAQAEVGAQSHLHPNVVVYDHCRIGARAIIHAGAVIGADGFGFAPEAGAWVKVPQIGRVIIGDDVEIGANTTIDRGAIDDTVIGDGVKLDNQIQIGHNVQIGAHTAIAACVGIAGSAKIGKHCQIGGAAGILGHLEICDRVTISPFSLVTKSIRKPGVYSGIMPLAEHRAWLANAAQWGRLSEFAERLARLEKQTQGGER